MNKFKVGDKVIGNHLAGSKYTITRQGWVGIVVEQLEEGRIMVRQVRCTSSHPPEFPVEESCFNFLESAKPPYPNPPHRHAELIKAWADGAEIELFCILNEEWRRTQNPTWRVKCQYRIKPQKPDKELKLEELEAKARELADEIKELRDE